MAFKRKLTFCVGMMAVLLWSTVSEAQVSKRYGKAVRNKFTQLNPYKIGQFNYNRPYSFLKGRDWRLKLLTPIYDTTEYTESPLDREQKFEGFKGAVERLLGEITKLDKGDEAEEIITEGFGKYLGLKTEVSVIFEN